MNDDHYLLQTSFHNLLYNWLLFCVCLCKINIIYNQLGTYFIFWRHSLVVMVYLLIYYLENQILLFFASCIITVALELV